VGGREFLCGREVGGWGSRVDDGGRLGSSVVGWTLLGRRDGLAGDGLDARMMGEDVEGIDGGEIGDEGGSGEGVVGGVGRVDGRVRWGGGVGIVG
jgi:hypothetical protein